jgi:hypothetical protein
MWQLHWIISLIPDAVLNWVYWAIITVGLTGVFAGWVGRFVPFYGRYVGALKPIGVAVLVLGVWLRGGYDVEMQWRAQTAELQAQADRAEQQSKDANKKLADEVRKNQKLNKDVKDAIKTGIKASASKIDSQCTVDSVAIELHNRSSRNEVPRGATGTVTVVPGTGTDRPVGTQVK